MEKDAGLEYGCVQAVIIPKSHTTLTEIIPLRCAERPTDNVQQSKGKSPTPIINSWWVRGNSALLPPSSISSLIIYYYVWAQFFMKRFINFFKSKKQEKTPIESSRQALDDAFGRMFDYASRQRGPYRIDNDIWYS